MAIVNRVPAKPKPGASKKIKSLHKKYGQGKSLKQFARELERDEDKQAADNWFFNKKANFSKPPLGIGSTRRKKGKGGKGGKGGKTDAKGGKGEANKDDKKKEKK